MFNDFMIQLTAFWPSVACGLVLVLTSAGTAIAVRHHRTTGTDDVGDQLFWDLFAGAAVAVPVLLMPSLASPTAGVLVAAAGVASGIAAYRKYPQLAALQQQRQRRSTALRGLGAAVERHQRTVAIWQRYELDPALAIDYPAMSDVRCPETARLIRALRSAETVSPHEEPETYSQAVELLEYALRQAEAAAGARPGNRVA